MTNLQRGVLGWPSSTWKALDDQVNKTMADQSVFRRIVDLVPDVNALGVRLDVTDPLTTGPIELLSTLLHEDFTVDLSAATERTIVLGGQDATTRLALQEDSFILRQLAGAQEPLPHVTTTGRDLGVVFAEAIAAASGGVALGQYAAVVGANLFARAQAIMAGVSEQTRIEVLLDSSSSSAAFYRSGAFPPADFDQHPRIRRAAEFIIKDAEARNLDVTALRAAIHAIVPSPVTARVPIGIVLRKQPVAFQLVQTVPVQTRVMGYAEGITKLRVEERIVFALRAPKSACFLY